MLYKQLYHILFTGYNRIKDSNSMLSDMTAKDKEIKMSELTLEKQSSTTDFVGGKWQSEINVRDFIQKNYTPYDGDSSFLAGPTEATTKLWQECCELFKKERENGGVLDMDTKIVSTITSHGAGYIDKSLEKIVGVQTDKPLKRSLQPFGGIRMAETSCKSYGYEVDPEVNITSKASEAGSSGGLMMSLTIYNQLVEEDITKGKKIVGTGTIDIDGNVGEIGGVKYKLIGAVKNDADIFMCPIENYEEAKKVAEEKDYDITIIAVHTFQEAIEKLEEL